MIYGYVRVSTKDQNEDRQMIAMREFGVERIYADKQSGKDFNRPEYQKLVRKLKAGDVLVIQSLDRFGRNYEEILEQWKKISKDKEADIVVLDMPLLDTRNDKNLTGRLIADIVLQLLAYVAQTEREFIRKRQREGIDAAKARGVRFGREAMEIPQEFFEVAAQFSAGQISQRKAAARLGVASNTFAKWRRKYGFGLPKRSEAPEETGEPAVEKRRYNVQPRAQSRTCRFNSAVRCSSNLCASCGWNTKIAKRATWSGDGEDVGE